MAQKIQVAVTAKKIVTKDGKTMIYASGKDIMVVLDANTKMIALGSTTTGDTLIIQPDGTQITASRAYTSLAVTLLSATDATGS